MVQVQLTAEKGSMFLPCSTDREIRLDQSKIAGTEILQIFKIDPSPQKCLGFHTNFSTYKREILATFFRLLEDLCVTLCEI